MKEKKAMNRQGVYGKEAFVKKMQRDYKVEALIKPKVRYIKIENENK